MKRPALYCCIMSIVAVILTVANKSMVLGIFFVIAVTVLFSFLKEKNFVVLLICAAISLINVGNAYYKSENIGQINHHNSGIMEMTAQLIRVNEITDDTLKAEFFVLSINNVKTQKEKIYVYIYDISKSETYKSGNIYRFCDITVHDNESRNPGQFDYNFYLKQIGISAGIGVSEENVSFYSDGNLFCYLDKLINLRMAMLKTLDENLSESCAELTGGILFGNTDKNGFVSTLFKLSGASHILAVSGLHVGIVYGFFMFILKLLKIKPAKAALISLVLCFVYTALSAFSISSLRAFIMLLILNIMKLFGIKNDVFNALCLAAVFSMAVNPLCIFTASFILSFGVTAGIILYMPYFGKITEPIKNPILKPIASYMMLCICSYLCSLPLSAALFGKFNLFSLCVNFLCVPLVGVIFISGILYLIINPFCFAGFLMLKMLELSNNYIISVCKFFTGIGYSEININVDLYSVILWFTLLALISGYIYLKKKNIKTITALTLCAVFVISMISPWKKPSCEVVFLDVGFSDCAVITDESGLSYMIDCGDSDYSGTAEYDIIPYLKHNYIEKLECVFITHTDSDHCGAIFELMDKIRIGTIYINNDSSDIYNKICDKASRRNIAVKSARAMDVIRPKNSSLSFEIILPLQNESITQGNSGSMVIATEISGIRFLFLADIEHKATKYLYENCSFHNVDIIKAAHHGSREVDTIALLERIGAEVLVVSVGDNNYDLPDKSLLTLAKHVLKYKVYRTDKSGAISVTPKEGKYNVKCFIK